MVKCKNKKCSYNLEKFGCVRAQPNKPFGYCPQDAIDEIRKGLKNMTKIKTVIIPCTLRLYNKAREHGWVIKWTGEHRMCIEKKTRGE